VGVASPEDVLVSQGFLLFYEIKDVVAVVWFFFFFFLRF
jgi:hypothetical protein